MAEPPLVLNLEAGASISSQVLQAIQREVRRMSQVSGVNLKGININIKNDQNSTNEGACTSNSNKTQIPSSSQLVENSDIIAINDPKESHNEDQQEISCTDEPESANSLKFKHPSSDVIDEDSSICKTMGNEKLKIIDLSDHSEELDTETLVINVSDSASGDDRSDIDGKVNILESMKKATHGSTPIARNKCKSKGKNASTKPEINIENVPFKKRRKSIKGNKHTDTSGKPLERKDGSPSRCLDQTDTVQVQESDDNMEPISIDSDVDTEESQSKGFHQPGPHTKCRKSYMVVRDESKEGEKEPRRNTKQKKIKKKSKPKVNNTCVSMSNDETVGDIKPKQKKQNAPKKATNEKKEKCNDCEKLFRNKHQLLRHACTKRVLLCDFCGKGFRLPYKLKAHIAQHKGLGKAPQKREKESSPCEQCGKVLSSRYALANHLKAHNNERDHVCPHCPKTFIQKANLLKHVRAIHENIEPEKSFLCVECGKGFNQKNGLDYHMTIHEEQARLKVYSESTDEKNIVLNCMMCHHRFPKMIRYLYHLRKHLASDEDFDAGTRAKAENLLEENTHLLKSTPVYKCDYCDMVLFYLSGYRAHIKTHSEDGPAFSCKHCSAKFRSLSSQKKHERIHANKFEFNCNLCNAGFTQKSKLKEHIHEVHELSSDMAMDCESVSRNPSKWMLPKQKRTFTCKVCSKECTSFHNLTVHRRTHNKDQPFQCNVCLAKFSDPSNLLQHGKRKHPDCPRDLFSSSKRKQIQTQRKIHDDEPDTRLGLQESPIINPDTPATRSQSTEEEFVTKVQTEVTMAVNNIKYYSDDSQQS